LDRLPEDLEPIGSTLRARHAKADAFGGGFGLSNRQVQKLIGGAVAELSRDLAGPVLEVADDSAPSLADPFPANGDVPSRLTLGQVVLWAWAQVPDSDRKAPAALLFYEYEHGLRSNTASPQSRTERLRWRRLAWSAMQVAQHRFVKARSGDSAHSRDRVIAPRRLVDIDVFELAGASREGINALMSLGVQPAADDQGDAIAASMELVRAAVHSGHEGAPELLGLLRDGMLRRRVRRGHAAVLPQAETKIQALTVILAREHRDVSGIPVGEAALPHLDQLLELRPVRRSPHVRAELVSDQLRTLQELAELYDSLGLYSAAVDTLNRLWERIDHLGDPDEEQTGGWRQQILLTSAIVHRHLAIAQRNPHARRDAGVAADQSRELALANPVELPASWAMAATTQRLSLAVDNLRREQGGTAAREQRLHFDVERLLSELREQSRLVNDTGERSTRSALLGMRLVRWRIALLRGDLHEIGQAQASALKQLGTWTLPADLETVAEFQRAGARLGIPANSAKVELLLARVPDRGHLRPRSASARS
jgi:hypothetical protein